MPIYTFECAKCGPVEVLCKFDEKPHQICGECGEPLKSTVDAPTLGKSRYQPGVILGSGEKVAGHFGRDALRNRKS